jgi:hypothetical protein
VAEYTEVTSEVLDIAKEIIKDHRPDLEECMIGFVFRDEAAVSRGKIILATTRKAPANIKPYLSEEINMLIIVAKDQWDLLSTEQRRALIDHELCHIIYSGRDWALQGHDFEEFKVIIDRYGLWNYDLLRLKDTEIGKSFQLGMVELSDRHGNVVTFDAAAANQLDKAIAEIEKVP